MIIFGSKVAHLKTGSTTVSCPTCGAQNSLQISVWQQYIHVFWIPTFPIGKTGVTQCSHCKQMLSQKQLPESFQTVYKEAAVQAKTPAWTFSGLILAFLIVLVAIIASVRDEAENEQLVLAPQAGDILEIRKEDKAYTLYKVDEVRADTVIVRLNKFESLNASGLINLKRRGDDAYSFETMIILKSQLKAMLDKREIIDIDRE